MQVHYESLDLLRPDIDDYCVPHSFHSTKRRRGDLFLSLSVFHHLHSNCRSNVPPCRNEWIQLPNISDYWKYWNWIGIFFFVGHGRSHCHTFAMRSCGWDFINTFYFKIQVPACHCYSNFLISSNKSLLSVIFTTI